MASHTSVPMDPRAISQVIVGEDEPQDNAMKRFRREVVYAGLIPEVRRRRYFENNAEVKKRKTKESRIKAKR